MKNKNIFKKFFSLIMMTILILPCFTLLKAEDKPKNTDDSTIIKVGFPLSAGFAEYDENENYSGYMYEYLLEIAKYTGWEYEMHPIQANNESILTMMNDLKEGRLDIIVGFKKLDYLLEDYNFPEYHCGNTYSVLSVLESNNTLTESDFTSFNGMKIGYVKSATARLEQLKTYATANNFTFEAIQYETANDLNIALPKKEIDAILGGDLFITNQTRILARFAPEPYYIISNKDNGEVLNKLNMSIGLIKSYNLNYDEQLYNKYFPKTLIDTLVLSKVEKQYIQDNKNVNVALVGETAPLEYYENNKLKGVTISILNKIEKNTGFNFNYIKVKSIEEAEKLADAGKVDLISGVYNDGTLKKGYSLLTPYASLPTVVVKNSSIKKIDVNTKILGENNISKNIIKDNNVNRTECNNEEKAMLAIANQDIDYFYTNSYTADYYRKKHLLENIDTSPIFKQNISYSFALKQPTNNTFLAIMNKAIMHIDNDTMQMIIYENTTAQSFHLTFEGFIRLYAVEIIVGILFLCTLILGGLFYMKTHKKRLEEDIDKRYRSIAKLTGDVLFQYNIKKEKIHFLSYDKDIEQLSDHFTEILRTLKDRKVQWENIVQENNYSTYKTIIDTRTSLEGCDHETWYQMSVLCTNYKNDKTIEYIGKIRNADKERRETNRLIKNATTDPLTKLLNKSVIREQVDLYLKNEGQNKNYALLIIDIDDFKNVNDSFGHIIGDKTLCSIANAIIDPFEEDEMLAGRIGGDEFIVFIKNMSDMLYSELKANEIIRKVSEITHIDDNTLHTSCSIGIAQGPLNDPDYMHLYKEADIALYQAKDLGKHKYIVYDKTKLSNT